MDPQQNVPALDDAALDRLKASGDPAADAVVAALMPSGREAVVAVNRLLARVEWNDDPLPADLPAPLRAFLQAGDAAGTTAGGWDEARLARGAAFFASYGAPIPLLLQLATMPTLYAASHAVKVLAFTARLERHAHRRSIETAQMVFDAMHPRGFEHGGAGRRSVQKVRLMHAVVRHFVLASGQWDDAWGVPLNLEDTLGVLGGFTCVIVDGLRKFGCEFTDAEADDYYYRWRVVGELIGLPRSALPSSLPALRETFDRMKRRQVAPSPEGRRLIRAWIDALEIMVPGRRFDHVVEPMIRHLVADDVAAALGLPDNDRDFGELITDRARVLSVFDRIAGRGNVVRSALDRMASTVIGLQMAMDRGGKRIGYALPVAIGGRWELKQPAEGEAGAAQVEPVSASSHAMHDFAEALDKAERDRLHASIARLVAHVVLADGRLDRLEKGAAEDLFETEIVQALGEDFRWSIPARRMWDALCAWKPGDPEPGAVDDLPRIGALVARMDPSLAEVYRGVVAASCVALARVSGPTVFSRPVLCNEERVALARIAEALGIAPERIGLD